MATIGDLIKTLQHYDPDLPIGIATIDAGPTNAGLRARCTLSSLDTTVAAGDPGSTRALWLTTKGLLGRDTEHALQHNRPTQWAIQRPCGCTIVVDASTDGTTVLPACDHTKQTTTKGFS